MANSTSSTTPTNTFDKNGARLQPTPPRSLYNTITEAVRIRSPITLRRRNSAPADAHIPQRRPQRPPMNALTRQNLDRLPSSSRPDTAGSRSTVSITPRSVSPEILEVVEYQEEEHQMVHVQNANYARGEFREVAIRLATVSRDLAQHPDPAWQVRARKVQVDAARYMHMALPTDLEPAEATTIAATLPREVLAILRCGERPQANALRRIVARVVTWAIALGFFIIPLLVTFLHTALRFEREHQVTERVIMNAQGAAVWLGACGPLLGNALTRLLETPIGRRLVEMILYVIEGIFGGVLDVYEPHLQLVLPQASVHRLEQ